MDVEDQLMGEFGYGNDLSFYNHSVDMSRTLDRLDSYKPDELDNSETVQRYFLNRLTPGNLPETAQLARSYDKTPLKIQTLAVGGINNGYGAVKGKFPSDIADLVKNKVESFENAVTSTLGENTVGILLTIVFMLIIAIVVLQIIHTRKVYKIMKTMMKNIQELHSQSVTK